MSAAPRRRIAFINEKGGSCKTTLAVSTAAHLARAHGQRVLLVDMDGQGHAAKSLGIDVRELDRTVFDLLTDDSVRLEDVVVESGVPGLSVLPSYKQMADFPIAVAADPERARRLARSLEAAEGYDVVVIDSPPSLGVTTHNVLLAAEEVVVPVALTYLSLDGCAEMVDTVQTVAERYGHPALRVTRVVPTLYRRTALADEILAKLREHFGEALTTPLPFSVKIDEAQSHGRTIWEHAPRSAGARLLAEIADQVWNLEQDANQRSVRAAG